MRRNTIRRIALAACLVASGALACLGTPTPQPTAIPRLSAIPADAVKVTPQDDPWPPKAGPGWSTPEPLEEPINTAGGEDSPFVTLDGRTLYFFFTPDVRVPAQEQVVDGVTGIWMAQRTPDGWGEPQRVVLASPDEPHLDGCPFVLDDWMVFCSVRPGNHRQVDLYTATRRDGVWTDWQNWGERINVEYQVGEMHVTADGRYLYFSSDRPGGLGGQDLWVSERTDDDWGEPVNLGPPINTATNEARPFVSADGQELWFDAPGRSGCPGPAIFRSARQPDGSWGEPEEVVSCFAAEPTLTADGSTLYFAHHYFTADLSQMIEADIYVTRRITP